MSCVSRTETVTPREVGDRPRGGNCPRDHPVLERSWTRVGQSFYLTPESGLRTELLSPPRKEKQEFRQDPQPRRTGIAVR